MDNGISFRQNQPENIRFLAAQRQLYSRAKGVAAVQAVLAAVTPVVSALVLAWQPTLDVYVAFIGIFVAIFDTACLDPKQSSLRTLGANVQESFDCRVLELPWNEPLAGRLPNSEDVFGAAKAYTPNKSAPLEDWYPRVVSSLPLYQGRVVCQRSNCWWDSKLRRRYGAWIVSGVCVLVIVVLAVALYQGMSLQSFVLAVLAPLLPALLWGAREFHRQRESAEVSDRLKEYCESLWDGIVKKVSSETEVTNRSRELQDAILIRRREGSPIFDWIYGLLRNEHEEQMNVAAQDMIDQIGGNKTETEGNR